MNKKNKILNLGYTLLTFIVITLLVSSNNNFIINLDNIVRIFIESHQYPLITNLMLNITKIGDVLGSLIIIIIFGSFLMLRNKNSLYIFLLATPLGIILALIIKYLVRRPRPYNLLEQGFGFPSSHATVAAIFLLSSIFLIVPLVKNKFSAKLFLIITSIMFPLVAFSRIYLSVHFTSDVIAGIFLGMACFMFGIICCHKKENVL
jgi:undecaprenyl-diphosphatase